jgi:halocyanin-like protein
MRDDSDSTQQRGPTRRETITYGGAVVGGGLLAGCTGAGSDSPAADEPSETNGDSQTAPEAISTDAYPVVDRWLGTDEVGGVDDSYDGTVADLRGVEEPRIVVGADGNGGPVAFEPSAAIVSPGTVVEWVWTAHGHHNVVSDPEAQLGESTRSFRSGDAVERENNLHTELFDASETILYHCEPHLGLGMKGALIVSEES